MNNKKQKLDPKKVIAFLYEQAEQLAVNVERTDADLYAHTTTFILVAAWASPYVRFFEPNGPNHMQVNGKNDNRVTALSAQNAWFETKETFFIGGLSKRGIITHQLGQRARDLFRKVVDEQRFQEYWIPKAVTDLLAETVEELNVSWNWSLSANTEWLSVTSPQIACSLFIRTSTSSFL
jgi:hypothetical protein